MAKAEVKSKPKASEKLDAGAKPGKIVGKMLKILSKKNS